MTEDPKDWDRAAPWDYSGGPQAARERSLPPLRLVNPVEWEGKPIPARRWIVEGLVPTAEVTLLTGDGGLGKTLLAQMLATSCATGRPWLGLEVERCRAMLIACEDTEEELMRRQAAINGALGVTFADLGDLRLSSRVGLDNVLMADRRDGMGLEPFYDRLAQEAEGFGPGLLALDSLHDFFAANENSRPQVRFFVNALARIARDIDGALLLNGHPSLTGLSSGSGSSGSTAWHNSVRSRLYLTTARTEEGEGRDYRELTNKKANYGATGGVIRLRWCNGVFEPEVMAGGMVGAIERHAVENVFLACLDEAQGQGRHVTDAKNSPRYAPKVFAGMGTARGIRSRDLETAMRALFDVKAIKIGTFIGPDRHPVKAIVRSAGSAGSGFASD